MSARSAQQLAPTDADLRAHRQLFPALEGRAYLNFGARGVMPRPALDAVSRSLETLQSLGPASRPGAAWIGYELAATRRRLAAALGTDADRLALVDSVSTACALVAWGIPWRPGDRVLVGRGEPPGTWIVLRQVAERFDVGIDVLVVSSSDPERWRQGLLEGSGERTRLVVLSHVDWVTGLRAPLDVLLDTLARERPATRLLVDGAQSAGVLPLELGESRVDYYAVAGQKWLGGPDGVAALHVRREAQEALAPTLIGWRAARASADGDDIVLAGDAQRYEAGTGAFALLAGLRAALDVQDTVGTPATRRRRIADLTRRLGDGLRSLHGVHVLGDDATDNGLVSFQIPGLAPAVVVQRLEDAGFVLRSHYHPPCVRACVHYLTLDDEIDRLLDTIASLRPS